VCVCVSVFRGKDLQARPEEGLASVLLPMLFSCVGVSCFWDCEVGQDVCTEVCC
jgi:hypothetical protein